MGSIVDIQAIPESATWWQGSQQSLTIDIDKLKTN